MIRAGNGASTQLRNCELLATAGDNDVSKTKKRVPIKVGDRAPTFSLPTIHQDGSVGLDDYKGRTALLLGMLRGLYCSFCRRQLAQLSEITGQLNELSVEPLVVITTPVHRARIYAEYYPTSLPLASDPDTSIHIAYGLPRPAEVTDKPTSWPKMVNPDDIETVEVSTKGELPEPITLGEAVRQFDRIDGFEKSEDDLQELDDTWTQLSGLVLIDKKGIVRWVDIEAPRTFNEFGHVASNPEILAAAQELARSQSN